MTEQRGSSTRPSSELTPDQFAVGEVAIFCRPGSVNFGLEVTITSPLKLWNSFDVHTHERERVLAYGVEANGPVFAPNPYNMPLIAEPRHLRKKRPPAEYRRVVHWDECPWQPEKLNV